MSTRYFIRAKDMLEHLGSDWSEMPGKLLEQAETKEFGGKKEPYVIVGTRFKNGDSKNVYFLLEYGRRLSQRLGSRDVPQPDSEAFPNLTYDDFKRIVQSRKPFFSKWDKKSPLLLHDKLLRFSWYTAGREFWEKLPRDITVENNNNDLQIKTLGDLLDALYGPNSTMEAVEGIEQGTYTVDLSRFR